MGEAATLHAFGQVLPYLKLLEKEVGKQPSFSSTHGVAWSGAVSPTENKTLTRRQQDLKCAVHKGFLGGTVGEASDSRLQLRS